jgi:ketosteroid isomerase-like protein
MDPNTLESHVAAAERLTAVFASHDLAAFESLYAEDIVVWHSHNRIPQTKAQNIQRLGRFFEDFADLHYEDITRIPTPAGFVQQHVIVGERVNAGRLEMPVCAVVSVRGSQIWRLDEYFDPAPVFALLRARAAAT